MLTSGLMLYVFISVGLCDINPTLRYYSSSLDDYTELPFDNAHEIFQKSGFNPLRSTVIFVHGFKGHPKGSAVTAVIDTYLERGDNNVVLLNWQEMAAAIHPNLASSYLNWAVPNVRKLGYALAKTLLNLSAAGLELNNTILVGHSLGAHICGIAGNTLSHDGVLMPWIIGLDPAGVGFENRPPSGRLNPGSASFVNVIHSDPTKYGFKRSLGTIDFWPNYRNGAVVQPGCDSKSYPTFSTEDLCNHDRSWQLLVDSLKYPGSIIGSYAKNYRRWKNASKQEREATTLELGIYEKHAKPGDYFFITSNSSPYGLNKDGL